MTEARRMGFVKEETESAGSEGHQSLQDAVAEELERLFDAVPEVDLATVYRTVVGLMGAHAVPHIAEAISAALRRGDIEMESRVVSGSRSPGCWHEDSATRTAPRGAGGKSSRSSAGRIPAADVGGGGRISTL